MSVKIDWRLTKDEKWILETDTGIKVSEVSWSLDANAYVDEFGRLLSKTFEGAKEAVEHRLAARGKK
jgi:hypothetical protein